MKKLIALLTIAGMLIIGFSTTLVAQDEEAAADTEMTTDETQADASEGTLETPVEEEKGFQQVLKEQFIAGDWRFMGIVLLTLVAGLALCIERIIYLNLSTTNNQKLLNQVESALEIQAQQVYPPILL